MISRPISFSNPLMVGGWQLDDRSWKPIAEVDIIRTVDTYLAMGVTSFDTADIYGRSEQLLGKLLQGRDCTIFTKAVFFGTVPTPNQVRKKVEASLRNLHKDCLDCVQIHWHNSDLDFAETLANFQQLVEEGKIRWLGLTNFNTPMLIRALNYASITVHQVQYSLIDRRVEQSMQALCLEHQIGLLAYGPLAGGYLSDKFRQATTLKLESDHGRSFYYSSMIKAHGGWPPVADLLQTLGSMAQKYRKTMAQVALNWVRQQPGVLAVISGLTLDRQHIKDNIEAMTWTLAAEDVKLLSDRSAALFQQPGDIYSYER